MRVYFRLLQKAQLRALEAAGIPSLVVAKVHEEGQLDVIDLIKKNEIVLVINTAADKKSFKDSLDIRLAALNRNVPYFTTLAGANALSLGLKSVCRGDEFKVMSLQEYHRLSLTSRLVNCYSSNF